MDCQATTPIKTEDKVARIDLALAALGPLETSCALCPRDCRVDRTRGPAGYCRIGTLAGVGRALLHYGEEPVLSGYEDWKRDKSRAREARGGSGAVFFTGCSLQCLFCQNHQLSWLGQGRTVSDEELAGLMLDLQDRGALNINLVTPTHVILPILRALRLAYGRGLSVPLVSNSSGYEDPEVLKACEGIIDIYLPDLKYVSSEVSRKLASAPDYFEKASAAVLEMRRQQPELVLDQNGIAHQGLIIRHLVLPGLVRESLQLLQWIKDNLSSDIHLSLMSQYRPCHRAPEEMRRPLASSEYEEVVDRAVELGFENVFIQPASFADEDHFVPDFSLSDPFKWE